MPTESKMPITDASAPSICAISIHGVDWKQDRFARNSPTANFGRWSKALQIHLSLLGLKFYVFPTLIACPDAGTKPAAHQNWVANDDLARAVILTALDKSEYEGLDDAKTAASLYTSIKARAEGEGLVRMVSLIQEVLKIQCSTSKPLTVTATRICNIIQRIFAIKALDEDLFKCVMFLNSLSSPQYEPIQAQVSRGLADATKTTPYTSGNICKLMETMQNLTALKTSNSGTSTDIALATTTKGRWRSLKPWLLGHTHHAGARCCMTWATHGRPCGGHEAPFCAHQGGAMEKQGFDAAHSATARAGGTTTSQPAKGKGTNNMANTMGSAKIYTQLTGPKGKVYLVEEGDLGKLQTLSTGSDSTASFAGLVTDQIEGTVPSADNNEWQGWMATIEEEDEPRMSINWREHTADNKHKSTMIAPLDQSQDTALTAISAHPFYIDTGATVHISPCKSDFLTLQPIVPKAIKGVGGSTISAHGVGNIRLRTAEESYLLLQDALYVPKSTVHLISVSHISLNNNTHSSFDHEGIEIVDPATGKIIAKGPLLKGKKLYTVDLSDAVVEHVLVTHQAADLETWH